ncbi:TetR/AcrR family transcriptional regulator [Antrihabitans cavernicola]|uniref:TetR/AcrR family transcriptional regulator n=1 Tax=Antrihabitans cavernicola TaxID=2495913 RepID=A0A5A7S9S8_9NOCA|nr:TetR/AcrR family transcriptional regulator [Spelaeibacter cavernicola]KAA0022656.1 TetR/AcrR family transcriptional regulator [Spelaeibacter cavernicola]
MVRLTRPESQARTHADLVATARDLFLTDGFANTSLERVAETAGYSKGAVYSNFANKNQLCLEALELIRTTKIGEVAGLLGTSETLDGRLSAFQEWAEKTLGDVGWTMLEFEFMVASRDDPDMRASLVASLSTVRGVVATMLTSLADSLDLTLPLPADDAASSLLSLGIGLGIQRAVDPTISAQLVTDGLRMFLTLAGAPTSVV